MPQSVAEDMFHTTARALCQHPDESQAQTAARTRQMVHATLALDPRDGLEMMLATLVVGHHGLILDSMKDVHQIQDERTKARAKSGIVALDRALLGLLREYRLARARPTAAEAQEATATEATAPEQPPEAPSPAAPPPKPPAARPIVEPDAAAFPPHMAAFQAGTARAPAGPPPPGG